MAPHEAALTDLISLARRRGGLTMEDLEKALPVNSMTAEEISHVLARLDQAGVDVEIDPSLLLPEDKLPARDLAPAAKRDDAVLPKPMPDERRQQTGRAALSDGPALKDKDAQRSESSASASIIPWLVAFSIILLVVFAAFAF